MDIRDFGFDTVEVVPNMATPDVLSEKSGLVVLIVRQASKTPQAKGNPLTCKCGQYQDASGSDISHILPTLLRRLDHETAK